MTVTQRAIRTVADVRTAIRNMTNEQLATTWAVTEQQPATPELAITRGWLIDELETRMSEDDFDRWIYGEPDGTQTNPAAYLAL